ncbi:hypothetical protein I3842_08G154200 [Carya illinoinensis]|uniref:Uncharacterized protein n=1 Tax=Carya illinoinensis TaxID=32201 RepID=A0A922JAP2_CARIL|nr:hypothetical protein I3842_08G154200 [Carya illinoinensis]
MEGERKKRKMASEEGEDDEEEKIEKFFALIRSTREVRDRLKSTGFNEYSKDQKEEKRVEKEIKRITVWNPTFQPEDFIEDGKSSKSTPGTTQPGPSKSTKGNEEEDRSEDGNHGLDLNLSL